MNYRATSHALAHILVFVLDLSYAHILVFVLDLS